jgi:BlaR1 peptidase M56
MITYILHVTVITTVCFLFYKLMLQKETFYWLNRWTLMGCLAVSFGLPLLPVPQSWSWRTKLDRLVEAGSREWRGNAVAKADPKGNIVVAMAGQQGKAAIATPAILQDEFVAENPVVVGQAVTATRRKVGAKRNRMHSEMIANVADSSWSTKPNQAVGATGQGVTTTGQGALAVGKTGGLLDKTDKADKADKADKTDKTDKADNANKATEAPLLRFETMATAGTPVGKENTGTLVSLFSRASLFRLLKGLFYCYLLGVLLFGLNFLLQLFVLLYQSYCRPVIKDGRFRIVEVSGNRAPCSFGNTIFINPENYDWETYNQILIHEKIHVSGRHTLDILLAEMALVIQWFNPFAWLYRREVENNLEFLTDASVLLHQEVERSAYQLSLLRVSAPQLSFSLTNNYNQSLLKRRIVMMNSKRSSLHTIWKYFFLIPVFTVLVCALNRPTSAYGAAVRHLGKGGGTPAGHGQTAGLVRLPDFWFMASSAGADTTKHPAKAKADSTYKDGDKGVGSSGSRSSSSDGDSEGVGYSNADLDAAMQGGMSDEDVQERQKLNLKRAELQDQMALDMIQLRGPDEQIRVLTKNLAIQQRAVDVQLRVDPQVQVNLANQDMLRQSFKVNVDPVNISWSGMKGAFRGIGDSDLRDGSWFATSSSSNDRISFELKAEDEDHSWSSGFTVDKSEITPFPGSGTVAFKLIREAGTISFKGQFDGQEGFGHFHFVPDPGYFSALKQLGVEDLEDRRQFSYFTVNIKKDYVDMIVHNGYPHVSSRDLISFAAMHIDKEFIQYWHGSGLVDAEEPRNLISLKALHIDRSYVDELKAEGYDHLDMRELQSMRAQHIDRAYIRSLGRGKGEDIIPVRDLVTYKALHIDSAYLDGLRKVGYNNLSRNEISSLYSMHVMPEYIKSLQDLGYKDLTVRDLTNLKAMHVTTEDIKGFGDIGLKDLDVRQLSSFKAMKITPEFIKGFTDLGYDDISANQFSSLKATGVTPEFVKAFKEVGFDHIPVNQLTSLKAMGVNAEYISKMRAKGFDSKDLNKYIRLKNDFN